MTLTDAQVARLKTLEVKGVITPDVVVADARGTGSPLHALFDWDIDKAAEAWWVECARRVIRSVTVEIVTKTVTFKAPYYTHDPLAIDQGYRSNVSLRKDRVASKETVIDELKRASAAVMRARAVAAALGLEDDIDRLMRSIVGLKDFVEQLDDASDEPASLELSSDTAG